jgi:CRP-like cAMP-binding protein
MLEKLARFSLFTDFKIADLKLIAPMFQSRTFRQGEVIFSQGEKASCLYLLTIGKVETHYKPYDGETIRLNSLMAGSVFGWSAVLGNEVYSSSVICATDCEVLMVCNQELRDLRTKHPQTAALVIDRLAHSVSARWSSAQNQVKSMIRKGVVENISPMGKEHQL